MSNLLLIAVLSPRILINIKVISFVYFLSLGGCAANKTLVPPLLEGPHSLIVNIDGLTCCEGIIRVAIYHDKAFWLDENGMVRGRIGMVLETHQKVEIHGLPEGNYAVAVHHDQNGDGKMNRLLGLLPKEAYGFSNNVGKYGPASFDSASLYLNGNKEITITLNHLSGRSTD